MIKKPYLIICLLAALLLAVGCSTKKNTLASRSYHNVTAKFNVFFNGKESFKKGYKKYYQNANDDYTGMLTVFPPVGKKGESQLNSDMDRTIKKSTKVITFHSIKAKPDFKKGIKTKKQQDFFNKKEYNKWVDDSYLLIGKSHFLKYDYDMAILTFQHILRDFALENVRHEARLWLARSYIETGAWADAEAILIEANDDKEFPKQLTEMLNACYADMYIRQKQYEKAVKPMQTAVETVKKRAVKTRYTYVLAQLYQQTNQSQLAYNAYTKVIKSNPVYTMQFNANINRTVVYQSGAGDTRDIIRSLDRMLREDKNKEYRDQIYYAKANIYYRQNDTAQAMANYKLSAQSSVDNTKQKTLSYLTLANHYYKERQYANAAMFYDSTMAFIDDQYEGYELIEARARNLGKLVDNLEVVEMQDSLQRLAAMKESERFKVIDGIIEALREAEQQARLKAEAEAQSFRSGISESEANTFAQQTSGGKWYFYNPSSRSFGQGEFIRKWGRRKLEDNWRRKNKRLVSIEDVTADENTEGKEGAEGKEGDKKSKENDKKAREYYLKNIPLTDSMMFVSHEKIQESLLNAGLVYLNDLKEPQMAIASFEEGIKRYTDFPLELEYLNQLFRTNRQINNELMTEHYRGQIIQKYPNSVLASVLQNPAIIQQMLEAQNKIQLIYEEAFTLFKQSKYPEAAQMAQQAIEQYPKHQLIPRLELIKAMSEGKQGDMNLLREKLQAYLAVYPTGEDAEYAQRIIARMDVERPDVKVAEEIKKTEAMYTFDLTQKHYIVLLLPTGGNLNQLSFNVINFNLEKYEMFNFIVDTEFLGSGSGMVLVKEFASGTEALNYYESVIAWPQLAKDTGSETIGGFVISVNNYPLLKKNDTENGYLQFFFKNYKR